MGYDIFLNVPTFFLMRKLGLTDLFSWECPQRSPFHVQIAGERVSPNNLIANTVAFALATQLNAR